MFPQQRKKPKLKKKYLIPSKPFSENA